MLIYSGHACGSICDDMAESAFSNATVRFDTGQNPHTYLLYLLS